MVLEWIDWLSVILFFLISLAIGIISSRTAGKSTQEFFLSGRNMPWWVLGVSMVATTFSADTPNLVTDIVRTQGVAGNWAWWAFLITGMLTVFVYAKLWRRSKVLTDLEFYEIRYSGKPAAFLRGFRAVYLGVFFNVMIMASVCLAAIKIGGIMLNLSPVQTILIASVVTVIYSSLGGLKGVLITDFFQFFISMIGSVWAAYIIVNLPEIGGVSKLVAHEAVVGKLDLIPDFSNPELFIPIFIIPIAVQWWSVWYPGGEPGGGGYVAQRMLSAKDEKNAAGATLLFNVAHYALRPWPWILIGLASIIMFPDLEALGAAFPEMDPGFVKDDLGYPAMLTYLPHGLLGLVVASLISAFMSTISTHLNWGSSYMVHDFYHRFIKPDASEKRLVAVGRISTVVLMILSALFALVLENALQAFNILLTIGAGTGLIYILRWFWSRINAYTEITGMVVSFFVAIFFQVVYPKMGFDPIPNHYQLLLGIGITTIAWVLVTFLTPPDDKETLISFYRLVKPKGRGWKKIAAESGVEPDTGSNLTTEILGMLIGCFTIYSALFMTGYLIYGDMMYAFILFLVVLIGSFLLFRIWNSINRKR